MVIFIDQSRYWRGQHSGTPEWTWLLESLFRRRPDRRPASRLEVLLLSRALACPEEPIERHRPGVTPGCRRSSTATGYTPTMPA